VNEELKAEEMKLSKKELRKQRQEANRFESFSQEEEVQ